MANVSRGDVMQVWYITFHGGESPGRHSQNKEHSAEAHHDTWNNIHVFGLDGTPLGKALDTHNLPDDLVLRELRGFAFGPDGDLYVANAYKDASQVLRFAGQSGPDGRHRFREVYAERHEANPGLAHPFDVAFGQDSHLYVPSQDTNIVGRYYGPHETEGKPGTPMPHPEALQDADPKHLLPGTFIPSQKHAHRGLHAVRGAIFGPDGDLYVADRDADSIKRYDGSSGAFQREYRHRHLTTPVHLAFRAHDGALLAGSRDEDAVFVIDPDSGVLTTLVESGAGGLRAPAGIAFGPDGSLYVSSRETRQILRFDASTGKPDATPFIDGLGDFPEFIALVEG
jgi:DNA-binding beta-propeller fold protein YncE